MWHGENFKGEAWISVGNEHIVNICISYIDKIMEMFMEEKVPFYMTYPMQNLYSAELEYEKDMERVRELYPREIAFIQEAVEKHCDKLEYEGSPMFAAYPDKETVLDISRRIYDKVKYNDSDNNLRYLNYVVKY